MAFKILGSTVISSCGKTLDDLNQEIEEIEKSIGGGSGGNYDGVSVGTIVPFTGNTIPLSYLLCDGRAVSRSEYPGLFDVIGTTYGSGDGSTTFNLPNLKGKIPVGQDTSDTTFSTLGKATGEKEVTLTKDQMPKHTHTQNAHRHQQNYYTWYNDSGNYDVRLQGSTGGYYSGAGFTGYYTDNATATNQDTGGDKAHNNIQPSLVVKYIIKASGTAVLNGNIVDSVSDGSSTNAPSQRAVQEYVDEKMGEGVSAKVIIDRWESV